jgi:hypothetical protein
LESRNEGSGISQKNLPPLQGGSPQGHRVCHMQRSQAQAAAGVKQHRETGLAIAVKAGKIAGLRRADVTVYGASKWHV